MNVCVRCNKKFLFKSPEPTLCRSCYDAEARERAEAEAKQRAETEAQERAEAENTLTKLTATYNKIQSMRGYNTSPPTMNKYLAICESFIKQFKIFTESPYAPVVIQAGKARVLHGYAYVKDFGYLPYEDLENGEARIKFDSILDVAEKKAALLRSLLEGRDQTKAEKVAKASYIDALDYSRSFPEDYVVLDVETTGLNHKRERIIEIAAVKFLGGVERDSFVTFVNPGRTISYEITQLTGIKNSNLRNAPFIEEVIPELSFFLGDLPIVAHNASFDRAFLADAYREVGMGLKNESIDTLGLARKAFPQLKTHKLSFLKSYLELTPRQSHRALADVYTTAELFLVCRKRLCSKQEKQKNKTVSDSDTGRGEKGMSEYEGRERVEAEAQLNRIIDLYENIQSMDLVTHSAMMTKNVALCEIFINEFKDFIASPYAVDVVRAENDRSIIGHVYIKGFGYLPCDESGGIHAAFDALLDKVGQKADMYRSLSEKARRNGMGAGWIFPEDYVVLDVETTGFDRKNNRMIEIAAVKYLNGVEVGQFVTLVNPGRSIPPEVTQLTGITDADVEDAPYIFEVLPGLMEFLGELPIVAHNAPFDMSFLTGACMDAGQVLQTDSIDTLALARKAFPGLKSYKLEYLKEIFDLTPRQSHRALADVYTTAELLSLCKECPSETLSRAIEIDTAHIKKPKYPKGVRPSDILPSSPGDIDPTGPLYGKRIVFTGTLSMERREAMQMAADAGAKVVGSVSSKTDYLVVGKQDIALVGDDGLSAKEEKALELNASGEANVQMISEADFLSLLRGEGIAEQISIFEDPLDASGFEKWLQEILYGVLDRNTTEHKHLSIRRNKGYRSVLYRGGIVFTYNFTAKKNWVKFPVRYARHLPEGSDLDIKPKQGGILIKLESEERARELEDVYCAALDEAIDNGARSYSCCSRYQECSDAGRCVNPYPDIAIECRYKINLKHGRNFYKEDS